MRIIALALAIALAVVIARRRNMVALRPLLVAGTKAPDFELPDADGNLHKLSDYRGRFVVLAFYPSDNTPGCSLEMKRITSAVAEFEALNAVPIGISSQDVASHRSFCDTVGIPFPLLADTEGVAISAYNAASPGRRKADRVTYIIDPKGVVAYVDRDVDMNLLNIPGDWLRRLKAIQDGRTYRDFLSS
ncbi:MAG TPA: peroxiredoxin [Capsulimonadaceae bacterium]|jgi:peroxiredoxin Q/BCP